MTMPPTNESLPVAATIYQPVGQGRLAAALASAQAKFGIAELDRVNPHFKSRYASLASIMRVVQPHLGEAGVAIVQMPSIQNGEVVLTTRLIHSSGESIESVLSAPAPKDRGNPVQGMASVLTYLRRYAISAMLGVATGEDDDGNGGDAAPPSPPQPKSAPPAPKQTPKIDRGEAMRKLHGVAQDVGLDHDQLRDITGLESLADLSDDGIVACKMCLEAQNLGGLKEAWQAIYRDWSNYSDEDRAGLTSLKDWCKARLDTPTPAEPAPTPAPTPTPATKPPVPKGMREGYCNECKQSVLWAVTQQGTSVRLDYPALRCMEGDGESPDMDKRYIRLDSGDVVARDTWPATAESRNVRDTYSAHDLTTCPNADQFRKGGKA